MNVPTERVAAGLLVYRRTAAVVEVFLVHPAGPRGDGRDDGVWSFPKGLVENSHEPLEAAARREFSEETGLPAPGGKLTPLGSVLKSSGKRVHAFAVEADLGVFELRANEVEMEWPKGSGQLIRFPEVDRGAYFPLGTARQKLSPYMVPAIDRLEAHLAESSEKR